ncbi:hypothetical protein XH87_08480 [Bradyrhizobium sp. CCBAU 53415]|nr:hypothetical protein [Bradyrhizobium sp. CCBAU 53415]
MAFFVWSQHGDETRGAFRPKPTEPETAGTNLPPFIDCALVLRIQVRGRGASGSRLNTNGGGNVRAYRVVV